MILHYWSVIYFVIKQQSSLYDKLTERCFRVCPGCFFVPAALSPVSVCIYGLWNEPARRKAGDRRTMEGKMALSIRLLNWNVLLVSFRHILTNGPALLFVYLTTAGTQTNPSDFTCRLTYVCDCCAHSVFAGTWRQISCLLSVRVQIVHALMSQMIFQHSGKRDASSHITVPAELNIFFCMCEWLHRWEGFAAASFDSSPLGYLHDCDAVTSLHTISELWWLFMPFF